jgi:predicted nuclease of restriction endonuclease-like (RecB) superfamily
VADDPTHRRSPSVTPTPVSAPAPTLPPGYAELLEALKADIRASRVRAAAAANRELLALYWRIGAAIVARQAEAGWGARVLDRLATDLQAAFPGVEGFSRRNLYRMRAFHLAYPATPEDPEPSRSGSIAVAASGAEVLPDTRAALPGIVPQAVAPLPWGHHVLLLERLKDPTTRRWYAEQAVAYGWSRAILDLQIEGRLHERQGKATTNFARTLPAPDSDLAQQTLKDPYLFDFLTLAPTAHERETERALVAHVEKFLLELGAGFAFVGRQVHLEVDGEDFYVDLLFYHLTLRCFVVVDLKAVPFRPEFAGQINFYCSVVDDRMRRPGDGPTIGLLLCKGKNRVVAEYALRDVHKPIGVADWETRLAASLPDALRGSLPTVEELEEELQRELGRAGDAAEDEQTPHKEP